jgi:segregation and condensation protein B
VNAIARQVEALLFLSPEPLPLDVLAEVVDAGRDETRAAIAALIARHDETTGLEVAELAGGFALRTRADLEDACDRLRQRPPEDRLSPAALETLAVVAYLEPVSRPDIGRLRGVAVDSTVANLVDRGLLEEAGRVAGTGAMRYRTTRVFQKRFGLRDSGDLPPIERFELSGPQAEELRAKLLEAGHLAPEAGAVVREVPPPPADPDGA